MKRLALAILALALAWCGSAAAHEIRPLFLDVRELGEGVYAVTWKRPIFSAAPLVVAPNFGPGCEAQPGGRAERIVSSITERFVLRCRPGLPGRAVSLDGLSSVMVDTLARLELRSGETSTRVVRPQDPVWRVPNATAAGEVFATYLRLGIEHILFGYDHLLFVFGLVLLVRGVRRLLVTATAFTVAHSITLAAAALGVVRLPVPPIEALIALSILFLAVEILRSRSRPDLVQGLRPASLAFAFGLLHGLGFASALTQIGLPQHEIPLSLLAFNLGVEIGQITFILPLLAAGLLAGHLPRTATARAFQTGVYLVGSLAAFWTIQRIAGF